jgi:hypothetical protein
MQNISGSASSTSESAGKINITSQKVQSAVSSIADTILDLKSLVEKVKPSQAINKNIVNPPKENKKSQTESIDKFSKESYSDVA